MPSGITYIIKERDDVRMEEFMMRCARQFGAFYHMRDMSVDHPYEPLKVSPYHKEQLEKALAKLIEYRTMSVEEAAEEIEAAYQSELAYREQRDKEDAILREKYNDMLNQVRSWNPPTSDHESLKSFAIKQIQESIDWDCSGNSDTLIKDTPEEYIQFMVKRAEKDIAYHRDEYDKEVKRVREGNQWVAELMASFKKERLT